MTGALGAKINSRRAVSSATASAPTGNMSIAFQVNRPGINENCAATIPLDGESLGGTAKGCFITLRASTRDWYLDCSKGSIKLPAFDYITQGGDTVVVKLDVTASGLTATGPLSNASIVTV